MELARETLVREMIEETGLRVCAGALLWVVEKLFHYRGTAVHELGLYFEMSVEQAPRAFGGRELEVGLEFRWFPLEEISGLDLRPAFLREGLRALPASTKHLVVIDAEAGRR